MKDVNEVLGELGMGKYQWAQLAMVGTLGLLDGAEILLASSVLESLEVQWQIAPWLKGVFVSVIFVGVLLGNIVGGLLGDTVGRRPIILSSFAGVCFCGLASSQAVGPVSLLSARFLFGIFYGLGSAVGLTLLVESCPSAWRGHVVNVVGFFFMLGEVFAAVLLIIFMPNLGMVVEGGNAWRWVTALGVAPGIVMMPMVFFMLQESPHYLMSKGREAEAVTVLRTIAAFNDREVSVRDLEGLRSAAGAGPQASGGSGEADPAEASRGLQDRAVETTMWQRTKLVFGPDTRYTIFGGAYILFVSNFLFFGLMYGLPNVFAHIQTAMYPAVQVLFVSIVDLPALLVTWLLIRSQFGHRDGLVTLAIIASFSFLMMTTLDLGADFQATSLPATYLAKYAASSFFTLSYVYLAEVFPSVIRTTALSFCIAFGRFGSIFAPPIFGFLTVPGSSYWQFFVFCACISALAVAVIRYALLVELKNQPLQEVPMSLKKGASAQDPLAPQESEATRTEMSRVTAGS